MLELKTIIKHAVNIFFPRACAGCGEDIPACSEHVVCDGCWQGIPRIVGLSCLVCGLPISGGFRCGDCRGGRRAFRFMRSAGLYEGPLKRMVRKLKYGGREDVARPLGRLLADLWESEPRLAPVDVVMSVPLHWRRERMRGYNQAALLAGAFGGKTGLPVLEGVLRRRRATRTQTELGKSQRGENVRDAFDACRPEDVAGLAVLLVDDVCTTGATLDACARALKKAGARRVGALTAARQVTF